MSTPRLKYNPKGYKRIAEIYAWLADGKNVEVRSNGAMSGRPQWVAYSEDMGGVKWLLDCKCEFRVKPSKPADKKAKGWVVE